MNDNRVVVETPCEHGVSTGHVIGRYWPREGEYCATGERRILTPGEYVLVEKVDGEWPKVALNHELVVGPLMLQAIADALASVAGKDT